MKRTGGLNSISHHRAGFFISKIYSRFEEVQFEELENCNMSRCSVRCPWICYRGGKTLQRNGDAKLSVAKHGKPGNWKRKMVDAKLRNNHYPTMNGGRKEGGGLGEEVRERVKPGGLLELAIGNLAWRT